MSSNNDWKMDRKQEEAMMRLLKTQFEALVESMHGEPREETLFTSGDLEQLEPLLRFLEGRACGKGEAAPLKLYLSRD